MQSLLLERLEHAKLQVLVCLQLDMGDLRYGKIHRSLMIWNRHSHSKLLPKRVEHMGDEHHILEADFFSDLQQVQPPTFTGKSGPDAAACCLVVPPCVGSTDPADTEVKLLPGRPKAMAAIMRS